VGRQVEELLAALDKSHSVPKREVDKPFQMPVEDVFSITGRGTVATGRIDKGKVKVGDESRWWASGPTRDRRHGVEMFRKLLDDGQRAQRGLLLRGVEKDQIGARDGAAKPG